MISTFRVPLMAVAITLASSSACLAGTSILFVGNSYTFGRIEPVMSYNAHRVSDLTHAMWLDDPTGSNEFEPHPWGGVPGIFKQFTEQAGLDYDVALSTRNAASLRGHFLNLNPAGWDLRGNIGSRIWDKVVLQEQSDEPLPKQPGLPSNPAYFDIYARLLVDYIHSGNEMAFRERDFFPGATSAERTAACMAETGSSSGTCNRLRETLANLNASADTEIYLYQTWARPNLVNAPFTTETDPQTGEVSFTTTPATSFYPSLQAMTQDLHEAYFGLAASDDGIKAVAPVGDAFLQAITTGVASPDMYSPDAFTDNRLDLWFDDGTHASKYGSYLSALVLFGTITGVDPRTLGPQETAAQALGIAVRDVIALQQVAAVATGFGRQPNPKAAEPATMAPGWRGGQH